MLQTRQPANFWRNGPRQSNADQRESLQVHQFVPKYRPVQNILASVCPGLESARQSALFDAAEQKLQPQYVFSSRFDKPHQRYFARHISKDPNFNCQVPNVWQESQQKKVDSLCQLSLIISEALVRLGETPACKLAAIHCRPRIETLKLWIPAKINAIVRHHTTHPLQLGAGERIKVDMLLFESHIGKSNIFWM